MKEYIAETGGRYTYSDDILNLQELALSMSAVFDGCSDFIISGCEIEGPRVSPGYVWLGGKVRLFDGIADSDGGIQDKGCLFTFITLLFRLACAA